MATRVKKSKAVEDVGQGFLLAVNTLAVEKGISPDLLFDYIEKALAAAYKKNFNSAQNVRVSLDRENGKYHVYAIKTVVEELTNPILEISLPMAKQISPHYEVDDTLEIEVTPANFGRVAAQAAKQVVVQGIREAERGMIFAEYSERDGDIISGVIQRIENKNVFLDLGKTEAVMIPAEQIQHENYAVNDRIRVLIIEVKDGNKEGRESKELKGMFKGAQVMVSRTRPELLKRLFELEVPEIHEGIVEIKAVAREAGVRSKISVYAKDEAVDAIGSCVGHRGFRVQAIVDELRNEKIDIVKWSADSAVYIANALSPAKVVSVEVDENEKIAKVVVPDYQLSLAIGKEGQNARLAAKLTGWKIDIKSESQAAEALTKTTVEGESESLDEDEDILAELNSFDVIKTEDMED